MDVDDPSSPLSALDADSDWYDPKESAIDLEHPKYWDDEVIVGIVRLQRRTEPLQALIHSAGATQGPHQT